MTLAQSHSLESDDKGELLGDRRPVNPGVIGLLYFRRAAWSDLLDAFWADEGIALSLNPSLFWLQAIFRLRVCSPSLAYEFDRSIRTLDMTRFSILDLMEGNSWENNLGLRDLTEASSQLWRDGDLCRECSTADVRGILLCSSERHRYDLGPLIAIKRRKHLCWLCYSVYTVCFETMPRDLLEALLQEDATPLLLSQERYGLGRQLVSEFVDVPCAQLRTAVFDTGSPGSAAWSVFTHYNFELCLNDAAGDTHLPITRAMTYEENSLYADYEQIGEWVRICFSKHAACQRLDQRRDIPEKFYLVDVHSRRVQPMDPSTEYVALSYTWGDSQVQRSVKYSSKSSAATQRLHFPRDLPQNAPSTVEDAMTAVKNLGQRYLWTDLYCINQTDAAERQAQIQQMGHIYEGALVTICAISSSDSTAGIHGISKPWQPIHQLTTPLESGFLQITGNLNFTNDIKESVWRTRAWTFQECKLAGRKLCFGAHGVFLWCGEEVFHHAIIDTDSDCHVVMRPDNPGNPEMYAAFEPLGFDSIYDTDLSDSMGDISLYFKLVNDFCRRQLSFEDDAQDAIAGLLHRMAIIHEASFIFGLPTNHITRTLMWSCGACLEHPRRPKFPSWTWLGWNADPKRTKRLGGQPEYEYWLKNWPELETSTGRRVYKLRAFWLYIGHSTDQGKEIAISVASEAYTSARKKPHDDTLFIKAQIADCQVRCLARHNEPVPGFTAGGEPQNDQLARGDFWVILDSNGETLPRDVILDTDDDQTEDYTFEISPEISSKFDPSKRSTGDLKLVLLQRWVEVNQETGEPEESENVRWGDRGWFLIVSAVGENRFERIALIHMEYEHFEAMDTKEERLILV